MRDHAPRNTHDTICTEMDDLQCNFQKSATLLRRHLSLWRVTASPGVGPVRTIARPPARSGPPSSPPVTLTPLLLSHPRFLPNDVICTKQTYVTIVLLVLEPKRSAPPTTLHKYRSRPPPSCFLHHKSSLLHLNHIHFLPPKPNQQPFNQHVCSQRQQP